METVSVSDETDESIKHLTPSEKSLKELIGRNFYIRSMWKKLWKKFMKTVSVSDKTDESIKHLTPSEKSLKELIGRNFYIRSVTYHCTAKVVGIVAGKFLKLEEAAWIADTPRFADFIKHGQLDEVEPYGDSLLSLDAIVEIIPWMHPLPHQQQ